MSEKKKEIVAEEEKIEKAKTAKKTTSKSAPKKTTKTETKKSSTKQVETKKASTVPKKTSVKKDTVVKEKTDEVKSEKKEVKKKTSTAPKTVKTNSSKKTDSSEIKKQTTKKTQTSKTKTETKKEEIKVEKKEKTKEEKSDKKISPKVEEKVSSKPMAEKESKNKIEPKKEQEKEEEVKTTQQSDNKSSHKTLIITCICLTVLAILLLVFSTIFALINSSKSTIISNINIWGMDVSGLTKEEATEKLSAYLTENLKQGFTLKHNEFEAIVAPEQFNITFSVDDAVNIAYSKGRSGNIFENNFEIINTMINGNKINPGFSYEDDVFDSLAKQLEPNFPDRLIEPSYYIEENNLIIDKGQDGITVDRDKLKNDIIYAFSNLGSINVIEIPVINKKASTLDLNKVHSEVYKAPKDAYYTTNPYAVYAHADGIDFAISMEEALNIFNTSEKTCSIPLQVLTPNVTTNDIGDEAFPDLLGSYYTNFSTSNWGRTTNIRLATEKVNGTVIMPGEEFSFNQTVGKRTPEAGFQVAAVYAAGTVTNDYGGGICQVSSTLYNSVLLANLEIVDRSNHMFSTGYVPVGRDATVSWGAPDFVFKNNRNYPIKILATVEGGTVSVDVYGLATPDDYEVELESYITQYIGYSTIERVDPSIPKGTTQVIENGSSGCKSVCYRILKKNGEVVDKQLLSVDIYDPHNKIIAINP